MDSDLKRSVSTTEKKEQYELHRLLGTLFSQKLEVEEKLYILKHEFRIELEDNIVKEVNDMCNLGEGIREQALAEGLSKGRILGISEGKSESIIKIYGKGYSIEQISNLLDIETEKVESILKIH